MSPSLFLKILPGLVDDATCSDIIQMAEAIGFAPATVRTLAGPVMRTDIRNNERILFTDESLRMLIWQRLVEHLPAELHGENPVGLVDGFKLYKYGPGQRFKPHKDGSLEQQGAHSRLTCLVYLNANMEGGETSFFSDDRTPDGRAVLYQIKPDTGAVVVFEHPWWHEGKDVISGTKYVLRTDVLYSPPDIAIARTSETVNYCYACGTLPPRKSP